MSVAMQVIGVFRSARGEALTVRDVIARGKMTAGREVVSKVCAYLASLGLADAELTASGHGRRYLFTASERLFERREPLTSKAEMVTRVLGGAREGLRVRDIRFAIRVLWGMGLPARVLRETLDGMGDSVRVEGGSVPRYVLGSAGAVPWRVLDAALRRVEAVREGARRFFVSSSSALGARRLQQAG